MYPMAFARLAEAPASPEKDADYWLQHTLGRLVTSPSLLERTLHGNESALSAVPDETRAQLVATLRRQDHRFRTLAAILDERLFKNARRFLPLVEAALPADELLRQWRAFREQTEDSHWPDHRRCALEFCDRLAMQTADDPGASRLLDIARYELAVLRLDDRLRTEGTAQSAIPAAEVGAGYPAVLVSCQALGFGWPVSAGIKAIRESLHPSPGERARKIGTAIAAIADTPEILLFFASWSDRRIRTMRAGPAVLALLAACDGGTAVDTLFGATAAGGRPECPPDGGLSLLDRLRDAGVLRCLQAPVRRPSLILTESSP
jgi:hypothetical protein